MKTLAIIIVTTLLVSNVIRILNNIKKDKQVWDFKKILNNGKRAGNLPTK